jgi:hypothetical protein
LCALLNLTPNHLAASDADRKSREEQFPHTTLTFILDPADPFFYFTPDGQKANEVDKELIAMQLRVAEELDAMLANGQHR